MYTGLLHLHSALRYLVLLGLVIAIVKSLTGWMKKANYSGLDNKLSLLTMIFAHLQLVIGFWLYFISPMVMTGDMGKAMKDAVFRFWTVEHIGMMIVGIALVTIGRISAKKANAGWEKHKKTAIFFLLGLIVILIAIPWWSFSADPRGLF